MNEEISHPNYIGPAVTYGVLRFRNGRDVMTGERWTWNEERDTYLSRRWAENAKVWEIAQELGVSIGVVSEHAKLLGLSRKRKRP